MWVSRFSIPPGARREDVTLDRELALETADQRREIRGDGDELRDRLAVLGDDDSLRTDAVEQGKALSLELGGGNGFHAARSYDRSELLSTNQMLTIARAQGGASSTS
jgi:hypothetical protein